MAIPDEPATAKQVAYALDLGLKFPRDITKSEMSDLLDARLSHDKPTSDRHREFAAYFGLQPSEYVGKRKLFDQIAWTLGELGREHDLAAWFVYRVCRKFVAGGDDHPLAAGPDAPVVREIATELIKDPAVVRSMRNYEGRDLIWFGQWTAPDGAVYEGGSMRTLAYKRTSAAITRRLGIHGRRGPQATQTAPSRGGSRTTGSHSCLKIVLVLVGLGVLLTVLALTCAP